MFKFIDKVFFSIKLFQQTFLVCDQQKLSLPDVWMPSGFSSHFNNEQIWFKEISTDWSILKNACIIESSVISLFIWNSTLNRFNSAYIRWCCCYRCSWCCCCCRCRCRHLVLLITVYFYLWVLITNELLIRPCVLC